jgi:hypothetical protein
MRFKNAWAIWSFQEVSEGRKNLGIIHKIQNRK